MCALRCSKINSAIRSNPATVRVAPLQQTGLIVWLLLLVLLIRRYKNAGAEQCIAEGWSCCAGRAKVALMLQTGLRVRLLLVLLVWRYKDAVSEHCVAEDWPCCAGRVAPIWYMCMQQTGLSVRLLLVVLLLPVIGCNYTVMYVLLRTGPCCADNEAPESS
jgi:hypothetical protein